MSDEEILAVMRSEIPKGWSAEIVEDFLIVSDLYAFARWHLRNFSRSLGEDDVRAAARAIMGAIWSFSEQPSPYTTRVTISV